MRQLALGVIPDRLPRRLARGEEAGGDGRIAGEGLRAGAPEGRRA